MLYLIGGMPRSATVWAFNVADLILRSRGIHCQKINANSPDELDAAIAGYEPDKNLLIHFHDLSENLRKAAREPGVRITYSYRDPRDIVCSQIRLHEVSFEQAVGMTSAACNSFLEMLKLPGRLLIPYYSATRHPEAVVFSMAFHLGHMIGQSEVETICRETSMEKFRGIMTRVDKGGEGTGSADMQHRQIHYDPETLINDRHIQSGRSGRWKDELTDEQQLTLEKIFGVFVKKIIL